MGGCMGGPRPVSSTGPPPVSEQHGEHGATGSKYSLLPMHHENAPENEHDEERGQRQHEHDEERGQQRHKFSLLPTHHEEGEHDEERGQQRNKFSLLPKFHRQHQHDEEAGLLPKVKLGSRFAKFLPTHHAADHDEEGPPDLAHVLSTSAYVKLALVYCCIWLSLAAFVVFSWSIGVIQVLVGNVLTYPCIFAMLALCVLTILPFALQWLVGLSWSVPRYIKRRAWETVWGFVPDIVMVFEKTIIDILAEMEQRIIAELKELPTEVAHAVSQGARAVASGAKKGAGAATHAAGSATHAAGSVVHHTAGSATHAAGSATHAAGSVMHPKGHKQG